MNDNGGTQKELYNLSKIPKDILPFLFKSAGYTREKQKYVSGSDANENITIENLLPAAREFHKQTQIAKLTNKEPAPPKVVVLETEKPKKTIEKPELMKTNATTNVLDFGDKEQMQHAILEVLDLTIDDLEALRSIGQANEQSAAAIETVSIFEEIKKLSGRDRANKTYFMSKELSNNMKEFADANNIKVSQIIEIAIIDFLKKY